MYSRPHSSPLTRVLTWLAVTLAALFGAAFALSSPALAQDDVPPDTTTEPSDTTTETPTDEPTEPEPDESTPTPNEAAPSAKKSEEDAEKSDGVTAAVEPDFGYNKFRVGVQLEDPSQAGGLTTLGSTIRITGEFDDGPEQFTECTTTLEDPVEPTTTYCEDLAPGGAPGDPDLFWAIITDADRIIVRQIGVNDGLEIIDGQKIVEPCGECEDDIGDVLLTDGVRSDSDDDDDDDDGDESDDEESDDREDGALPNVGAPDPALLGYGAILVAIGSRLIAGGRSHPRHRADGAVV